MWTRENLSVIVLGAAFVLLLVAYVILRLDGLEGGPLDEGILILIGAIAGIATPELRRRNP